MMRKYKRKREGPAWTQEDADAAIQAIRNETSIREASRRFSIPKTCLLRRMKQNTENVPGPVLGRHIPVFSADNEQILVRHVLEMQSTFYGLTAMDVRRIAFDIAEKLKMKHPFNKTKKVAGEDRLQNFLKRNPQLSIRRPEATSMNRAVGFNQDQVTTFFNLLKSVLEKYSFGAENIYNYDETGISTVPKPTKILAKKGQKQVGRIVSGERGSNITVACAFSVTGNHIPPFYLFPRKRLAPSLLKNAPPGSLGFTNGSGWMDSEHFLKYLDHFIEHTKPSEEKPVLLILDGHISHKQLGSVLKAKENNVVMLTLPPHCSHRMQPLDLTFFGPFKAQYARECDFYMTSHKGEVITIHDVVGLSGKAFQKVATVDKAVKGFEKSGIYPFNPDIFGETDFLPSTTHENTESSPINRENTKSPRVPPSNVAFLNCPGPSSSSSVPGSSSFPDAMGCSSLPVTSGPSCSSHKSLKPGSLNKVSPTSSSFRHVLQLVSPTAATETEEKKNRRSGRKEKSTILTSTPNKTALEEMQYNKSKVIPVKKRLKLGSDNKETLFSKKGKSIAPISILVNKGKKNGTVKDGSDESCSGDSDAPISTLVNNGKKNKTLKDGSDESCSSDSEGEKDYSCIYCDTPYKDSKLGEAWIQCPNCEQWAHEKCAGAEEDDFFICELCQ